MSRGAALLAGVVLASGAVGSGCDGDDAPPQGPGWVDLLEDSDSDTSDLNASILSVNGPSLDNLFFAGGTMEPVEPAAGMALHFDGTRWERLPIETPHSFWWVWVTPEGTAWFAGEAGTIVRWRGGEATFFETAVDGKLYGIWGTSDSNVWAVGGAPLEGDKDVILHFDGDTWTRVPPPETFGVQFYKVWGTAANDVFVVGQHGAILHFDGMAWSTMDSGTRAEIFTVHGRAPDDVWAVGFELGATILHYDGHAWSSYRDPSGEEVFPSFLNGVFETTNRHVFCVGPGGAKIWIRPDGRHSDETLEGTPSDLHGVWADAEGHAIGVGGNFFVPAPDLRQGTITFRGHAAEMSLAGLP